MRVRIERCEARVQRPANVLLLQRCLCRGGRLSPIIGMCFFGDLDEWPEKTGLFFVRTTDDLVVPAPTWGKHRAAA